MTFLPFTSEHAVSAHDDTTITAVYTNEVPSVDAWIQNATAMLAAMELKLVGVHVKYTGRVYTRGKGYVQSAVVVSLCVGQQCLVYQICCAAEGIAASFDAFIRNRQYRFAGFNISKDTTMLYRCSTPLFIFNHVDIHKIWSNPDKTHFRKEGLMDVAALFVDISYKDYDGGLTNDDHRVWGDVALSNNHLQYAATNAYVCSELYKCLQKYERGFFRRLFTKKKQVEQKVWGWGWWR